MKKFSSNFFLYSIQIYREFAKTKSSNINLMAGTEAVNILEK